MTAPFPHRFEADLFWNGGFRGTTMAGMRPAIAGGPPSQFDGSDEWWSPEHLLVSAANLCLMTTFFALAARANLTVRSYRSHARGELDRTKDGLAFTRIAVQVSIEANGDTVELARATLESAKRHCIVANALKAPLELEAAVHAA